MEHNYDQLFETNANERQTIPVPGTHAVYEANWNPSHYDDSTQEIHYMQPQQSDYVSDFESATPSSLVIGSRVEAQWGDLWYPGILADVIFNDSCALGRIEFDDYPQEVIDLRYVRCAVLGIDYDISRPLSYESQAQSYQNYQDNYQSYQASSTSYQSNCGSDALGFQPLLGRPEVQADVDSNDKSDEMKYIMRNESQLLFEWTARRFIILLSFLLAIGVLGVAFKRSLRSNHIAIDVVNVDDGIVSISVIDDEADDSSTSVVVYDDGDFVDILSDDNPISFTGTKPHIVLVVADDLAWNSLGISSPYCC